MKSKVFRQSSGSPAFLYISLLTLAIAVPVFFYYGTGLFTLGAIGLSTLVFLGESLNKVRFEKEALVISSLQLSRKRIPYQQIYKVKRLPNHYGFGKAKRVPYIIEVYFDQFEMIPLQVKDHQAVVDLLAKHTEAEIIDHSSDK